jgi:AGZA family xanthine/uracil permease-like MFS transporter
MGFLVNVPVALAPGMGLNGYFNTLTKGVCWDSTTGVNPGSSAQDLIKYYPKDCPSWGKTSLPWTDAMGAVFISGWFYLFFTFTGLRSMLFVAVPKSLRASITVGIGFFITIIGLKIGEITRVTQASWSVPTAVAQSQCFTFAPITPPAPGAPALIPEPAFCNNGVDLDFATYEMGMVNFNMVPQARISVLGLILVSFFTVLRSRSAIIISIVLCTFLGINYGTPLKGSSETVVTPFGGVNAVTNLASWYAYDEARYRTPGMSDADKQRVSNRFFLPEMDIIPSGHLSFKYARTPIFWEAVCACPAPAACTLPHALHADARTLPGRQGRSCSWRCSTRSAR